MARRACIDDLRNYFKISDLLGGLTEPQKRQLRNNIGLNTDDAGNIVAESLSYEELINKIRNKSLSAGLRYIIADYQTIYQSNHLVNGIYETWGYEGHVESQRWHLIVTAVSEDLLDRRVTIIEHPEYIVEYDVKQITFQDGVTNKGTITYLKDPRNNSAYYDFKNVRFKRINPDYSGNYYTFSYRVNGELQDNSETNNVHDNELKIRCWNNVFMGDTYYNILEPDSYGNTFFDGCRDCHFYWESVNNIFREPVVDLSGTVANLHIARGVDIISSAITKQAHNIDGGLIITYLDPITYSQQVILRDSLNGQYGI